MTQQTEDTLRDRAKKRVGFKLHIFIALGANALMFAIYYVTWTGYPWPLWCLLASIISLFIHWLAVFSGVLSVNKEVERLNQHNRK